MKLSQARQLEAGPETGKRLSGSKTLWDPTHQLTGVWEYQMTLMGSDTLTIFYQISVDGRCRGSI